MIIIFIFYYITTKPKIGPIGSTHEHTDFKVYIDGEVLDFAQQKYMVKSQYVHVENMDGTVIHKHATGITLRYFFKTLGFGFNDDCFILDDGQEYCNGKDDDKTLKFYVNNERNYESGAYEIKDEDKYLISYGNDSEREIQKQLDSV